MRTGSRHIGHSRPPSGSTITRLQQSSHTQRWPHGTSTCVRGASRQTTQLAWHAHGASSASPASGQANAAASAEAASECVGEVEVAESRVDVGVSRLVKMNVIEVVENRIVLEGGHCNNVKTTLSACELEVPLVTTWMAAEKILAPTATIQFLALLSTWKTKF